MRAQRRHKRARAPNGPELQSAQRKGRYPASLAVPMCPSTTVVRAPNCWMHVLARPSLEREHGEVQLAKGYASSNKAGATSARANKSERASGCTEHRNGHSQGYRQQRCSATCRKHASNGETVEAAKGKHQTKHMVGAGQGLVVTSATPEQQREEASAERKRQLRARQTKRSHGDDASMASLLGATARASETHNAQQWRT